MQIASRRHQSPLICSKLRKIALRACTRSISMGFPKTWLCGIPKSLCGHSMSLKIFLNANGKTDQIVSRCQRLNQSTKCFDSQILLNLACAKQLSEKITRRRKILMMMILFQVHLLQASTVNLNKKCLHRAEPKLKLNARE